MSESDGESGRLCLWRLAQLSAAGTVRTQRVLRERTVLLALCASSGPTSTMSISRSTCHSADFYEALPLGSIKFFMFLNSIVPAAQRSSPERSFRVRGAAGCSPATPPWLPRWHLLAF